MVFQVYTTGAQMVPRLMNLDFRLEIVLFRWETQCSVLQNCSVVQLAFTCFGFNVFQVASLGFRLWGVR